MLWLVLDTSYLAYRAYHAIGTKLRFGEIGTTVIYGVLREVLQLQERFNTHRVAWCFDAGRPKRLDLLPTYKSSRRQNKSTEDKKRADEVRAQVLAIKTDYAQALGYRNVLWADGYEADDIIASVVKNNTDAEFVIVSSDHDMFQLLGRNTCIWNPSKQAIYSESDFRREWGLHPWQWCGVKQIAGCSSDDIPGVAGVGEKTAAKYLQGGSALKPTSVAFKRIEENKKLVIRNKPLVSIPFDGLDPITLRKQPTLQPDAFVALIQRLGMNSLLGSLPGLPRCALRGLRRNEI